MPKSTATTVDQYLAQLPADRRAAIARVREVVNQQLPRGFEEGMLYGMISWYVPLARFPETYNGQPLFVAALASQKAYMAIYLNGVYSDPALEKWFRAAWKATGKKLDMGKSCIRFASLEAIPLDVVGETIAAVDVERLLALYADARTSTKRAAKKPAASRKPAAKPKRPAKQRRSS